MSLALSICKLHLFLLCNNKWIAVFNLYIFILFGAAAAAAATVTVTIPLTNMDALL